MKTIALIPCVKEKREIRSPAGEMYTSTFFQTNLEYAKANADDVFILSGKYGLLTLEEKIDPYDVNLHDVSEEELIDWSKKVIAQLSLVSNPDKEYFIILVDEVYRKHLIPSLRYFEIVDLT